MKKLISLMAPLLALLLSTAACSYDDKDLWNAVDDLDYRVEALEEAVKKLTEQTSALQGLLDGKLFIESVEDDGNGTRTIHLISASGELSTIVITDGTDGEDGEDGKSPSAPNIGVERDADGNYFWTIDGEPLLDADGNQVPVNGTDGSNGTDGKTPTFKIEDGKWWVSFDNGINWTGPYGQATGADGDAFFKDATVSADGQTVTLTLIDGTVITLQVYHDFNLAFEIGNILIYSGQTKEIPFKVTGATPETVVEAVGRDGWKASVEQTSPSEGTLRITAPDEQPGTGRIIVFAGDGADRTIMRTLTFVAGSVEVSTSSIDIPQSGGTADVTVTTNLDFTAQVEPEAQGWLTLVQGRAYETRTEKFTVSATINETPYARVGRIYLTHEGQTVETVLAVQAPVKYDENDLVIRIDPSLAKGGLVYLPTFSTDAGAITVIDWGDGTPVESHTGLTNKTELSHTYTDTGKHYSVTVKGQLKSISGSRFFPEGESNGIIDIIQWGKMPYTNISIDYFRDLKHVPAPAAGVFSELTGMKLSNCYSLETIDPGLLKGASKLSTMIDFLRNATSLKEIPDGLFDDCSSATNLCELLKGCSSLRRLPDFTGLTLKKNANLRQAFAECSSLTELPERLFNNVTMGHIGDMSGLFMGCTSLEFVPDGFFDGMTTDQFSTRRDSDAKLKMMFSGCSSLKKLPLDFMFNVAGLKCTDFSSFLNGCSSLTMRPAPYELTVDGTTYKIEPWERINYVNHENMDVRQAARDTFWPTTPALSTTLTNLYGTTCFKNCINMPGYFSEIPQNWGGGWDGTSNPPKLKVTATLRPGAEYYAIDFLIKGQSVSQVKYYLTAKAILDDVAKKFNNDYTAIVNALGVDIEPEYIAAVNTTEGLTLGFDAGVPEVEYVLIVSASNSHGNAFQSVSATTEPMPKGDGTYDKLIGSWRVTSSNSICNVSNDLGGITFDLEITPLRINESYLVTGWGASIYRNAKPTIWYYENGKAVVYSGNADKGMGSVLATGINYKDDYGDIDYNCSIYPYADLGDGNMTIYAIGIEPLMATTVDASGNSATMVGLESELWKKAGGPGIYCRGMEAALGMGGPNWSRIFTPAEIYYPEYTITSGGQTYPKMSLEPYSFVKITGESDVQKLRRHQPRNRSLHLGKSAVKWQGTPMKATARITNRR